ncbi:polysaccharide pyruvyl transferase family protein [Micrococcaceae bacterium RIT802]|nr:polysaccharide pyruvyl transferase family protein [Micrococcaceae bacterium RIT 802]
MNFLGACSGTTELIGAFVASHSPDVLMTLGGGYALAPSLRKYLSDLDVSCVSINLEYVGDSADALVRRETFDFMSLLPDDPAWTSIPSVESESFMAISAEPSRRITSSLAERVRRCTPHSVLVLDDGLPLTERTVLESIIDTHKNLYAQNITVTWADAHDVTRVTSLALNHEWIWVPRPASSRSSALRYAVKLAQAAGPQLIEDPKPADGGFYHDALRVVCGTPFSETPSGVLQGSQPSAEDNVFAVLSAIGFSAIGGPLQVPPTVLISGWYGSGNVGDEFILTALLAAFSEFAPHVSVKVVTPLPASAERTHATPAIDRNDTVAVEQSVRGAAAVVLGGGGLMQDYAFDASGGVPGLLSKPAQSIGAYGAIALLSALWGKPLYVHGQGIGPLRSVASQQSVRFLFESAASIVVRDPDSAEMLRAIKGWRNGVSWSPDLVFSIPDTNGSTQSRIAAGEPYMLFNLREWGFSKSFRPDLVTRVCAQFAAEHGLILVGVPLSVEDELFLKQQLSALEEEGIVSEFSVLPYTLDLEQLEADFRAARLVVGMRYHCCLLAMKAGVPIIGLAYDPKVSALFRSANQKEYVLSLEELQGSLEECLQAAFQLEGRLPADWQSTIDDFKSASKRTTRKLIEQIRDASASPAIENEGGLVKLHECE